MAKGENPVLSTLLDINAVSLERTELDPQSLILIRLAALIAVDAPVSSYLLHLGAGAQAGLTLEQAEDVLVAVAPIAGTPRTASAAAMFAAVKCHDQSCDNDRSLRLLLRRLLGLLFFFPGLQVVFIF